jgi:hypothetical protein
MSDDTTNILATLPNDVVDGLRQRAEDKHLTLTAALPQAITTSKFIHDETKHEEKFLINEGQRRVVADRLHAVSYELRWTCQRGNPAMSSPVLDLDAEKLGPDVSPRPQRLATVAYDPGRESEGVRTKSAVGSSIVTAGVGITPLLWALIWHNPVKVLLTGMFTPFFGLTGSVIGFLWRECR